VSGHEECMDCNGWGCRQIGERPDGEPIGVQCETCGGLGYIEDPTDDEECEHVKRWGLPT
jgi:hypothetical protein